MKPFGLSILVGAAALGLAPAPVAARLPSEWVGQWELDPDGPGKCVVSRLHTGGTRILIFGQAGGIRTLIVNNPGWPAPDATSLDQLVSLRGGERLQLPPDGRKVELDAVMAARVAASDAIEVLRPDGSVVEKVDLSGIAAAEARLPACMKRAADHPWTVVPAPMIPMAPPPPPTVDNLGTPPRAKVGLQALFTDMDYPSAAVRADERGTVVFELVVATDGRVAGCLISASSGSESLDSATCRVLGDRAVFEPARDRHGKPAIGIVSGRVVWSMPQSEPLPQPPR